MSDSDDKYGLSPEDGALWRSYLEEKEQKPDEEDFEALLKAQEAGDNQSEGESSCGHKEGLEKKLISENVESFKPPPSFPAQLDRRTEEKLRKGKMPIEARLDLHGMTQAEAHDRLKIFIDRCYHEGLRTVLIITGKGKSQSTSDEWLVPSKGVLKENAPHWLSNGLFKRFVLKYFPAQPRDGGSGALYVYLKRKR